ncbi:endonuclease/exonuclease/phosphatase family protein [Pirellulaceae bacterium SH449]
MQQRFLLLALLTCFFAMPGCSVKNDEGKPETVEVSDTNLAPAPTPSPSQVTATPTGDPAVTEEFIVLAYNVENLFDLDGIAVFDDYKPEKYNSQMLWAKLSGIRDTLSRFRDGKGPQIVLFQEFEGDQTPASTPVDYRALLSPFEGKSVEELLSGEIDDSVRDWPVEAFLIKLLQDEGLGPYNVAVGEYRPDPTGRAVAHVNVTFSTFPIQESRTHHTSGARGILEVVHQIGDHKLYTFNNHWKSGASDKQTEPIRLGNAEVLRNRLNVLLEQDPSADIITAGDFNSHYNQSQRFPEMEKTAVNDVLLSHGNEGAIVDGTQPGLYNLWYELPREARRSDSYRGQWGTLMQMMISRGLYDYRGVQYVDNSFSVAAFEGLNAQTGSLVPINWKVVDGRGGGISDHLPITARFRLAASEEPQDRFLELRDASSENPPQDATPLVVGYANPPKDRVRRINEFGSDEAVQQTKWIGEVFLVEAVVSGEKPFVIKLIGNESDSDSQRAAFQTDYKVWAFDLDLRLKIYEKFPVGSKFTAYGELGYHESGWQFVVRDPSWLIVNE